jgi:hypothetical protein
VIRYSESASIDKNPVRRATLAEALLKIFLRLNVSEIQTVNREKAATENRSVGGSIPPLGTIKINDLRASSRRAFPKFGAPLYLFSRSPSDYRGLNAFACLLTETVRSRSGLPSQRLSAVAPSADALMVDMNKSGMLKRPTHSIRRH